jgi:hypothetical protein
MHIAPKHDESDPGKENSDFRGWGLAQVSRTIDLTNPLPKNHPKDESFPKRYEPITVHVSLFSEASAPLFSSGQDDDLPDIALVTPRSAG